MEENVNIDTTDNARNDNVLDSVRKNIKKLMDMANLWSPCECQRFNHGIKAVHQHHHYYR